MIDHEDIFHLLAQQLDLPGKGQILVAKGVFFRHHGRQVAKHGQQAKSGACFLERLLADHWKDGPCTVRATHA